MLLLEKLFSVRRYRVPRQCSGERGDYCGSVLRREQPWNYRVIIIRRVKNQNALTQN